MKVNENRVFVVAENPANMPDLMFDWAAAIAGGATLAGGIMQASTYHPSKDIRHAKELAKYNSKLNEDMYLKYGTPEAQMKQYQEAGLNPNLIYGNASTSVPQAGQVDPSLAQGASGAKASRFAQALQGLANGITQYQQIVSQDQQLTNAKKQADYIAANTALVQSKVDSQNFKNAKQEEIYNLDKALKSTKLQSDTLDLMVNQRFKFQKELASLNGQLYDLEHKKNRNAQDSIQIDLLREKRNYIATQSEALKKRIEFTQFSMDMQNKKYDLQMSEFAERQFMNRQKLAESASNFALKKQLAEFQAYKQGMQEYQFDTKMGFANKQANRMYKLALAKMIYSAIQTKQSKLLKGASSLMGLGRFGRGSWYSKYDGIENIDYNPLKY